MKRVVRKLIPSNQRAVLEHPKGLRFEFPAGVFPRDALVEVVADNKGGLIYGSRAFSIKSAVKSVKAIDVSILVNYKPRTHGGSGQPVSFVEIKQAGQSYLIAGKLQERIAGERRQYSVVAQCELFKEELNARIGGGVFRYPSIIKRVFHPVQHQFKINEAKMEQDALGNSRRQDELGRPCDSPHPCGIYPACYPASWASLCSAYRMIPQNPRRRWELGTPAETNPPPNEFGDYFSTWAMGAVEPGDPPCVARVETWRADPSNPTPESVIMQEVTFAGSTEAADRKARADLIKSVLLREVGGQIPPLPAHHRPRPVRMRHQGHAWVIVGVDRNGFWDHALGDDAWSFSSYCGWEAAPWIDDSQDYYISFPPRVCELKPEEMRLGCINLEGSSDRMKRIRFWDVYSHHRLEPKVIHWVPHTRTDPGYLWIYSDDTLDCLGYPKSSHFADLGHPIPRPSYDFGHCRACDNEQDGCSRCRSRLLLPFWVHNTTLDETVTYKVNLYFWSKDQRWVTLQAKRMETPSTEADDLHCGFPGSEWTNYNLPGQTLPGEQFTLEAKVDTDPKLTRSVHWNSQGFVWYVDFHRNQLASDLHGVRLVLTCIARSGEFLCQVQDIKQIWFWVFDPAPL